MRKGEKESRKKKEQFLSFCLTFLKKTNNSMNSSFFFAKLSEFKLMKSSEI